jgi:hypothetical protein
VRESIISSIISTIGIRTRLIHNGAFSMAENGNNMVNVTQPAISIFKGENYEFWNIKMKTLFKSHGV